MRLRSFAPAIVALCASTTASSQMFTMQILEACYDPTGFDTPRGKQVRYAEEAFQRYIDVARASGNLSRAFSKVGYVGKAARRQKWILDGAETTPDKAIDPWIARSATFKPLGLVLSRTGLNVRGQWEAVSSDGTVLGTYDAFLVAHLGGYRMRWLELFSPSATRKTKSLEPFCSYPGDIEEHQRDPKAKLF